MGLSPSLGRRLRWRTSDSISNLLNANVARVVTK